MIIGLVLPALVVGALLIGGGVIVVAGALVPAVFVLPLLLLLDRAEPEDPRVRWGALGFGLGAAAVIAGFVNTVLGAVGGEVLSSVVSAPLIEEAAKAMPVVMAVRRGSVRSVTDGVIIAGWSACGFTIVEDLLYLMSAHEEGEFAAVLVARVVFMPFAHILFSACIGAGLGVLARSGRRRAVVAGACASVGMHAAWNGSIAVTQATGVPIVVLVYLAMAAALVSGIAVLLVRGRREQRAVAATAAMMLQRGWITPRQHGALAVRGWDRMRSAVYELCLSWMTAEQEGSAHTMRARDDAWWVVQDLQRREDLSAAWTVPGRGW